MKKISKNIVALALVGTVIVIAIPILFILLGYSLADSMYDAEQLANEFVSEGKSAESCLKIKTIVPTYPPLGVIQSGCIYEYAKLSKDPTACELLLPSSYGWSCLGASEEPNQRWCWFDFGPNPPQVGRRNVHASFEQCHNIDELQQSRCCELADVLYVNRTTLCTQFSNAPVELQNQCLELLARRDRNITLCESITSNNLRVSCEVAVRALLSKSKSL